MNQPSITLQTGVEMAFARLTPGLYVRMTHDRRRYRQSLRFAKKRRRGRRGERCNWLLLTCEPYVGPPSMDWNEATRNLLPGAGPGFEGGPVVGRPVVDAEGTVRIPFVTPLVDAIYTRSIPAKSTPPVSVAENGKGPEGPGLESGAEGDRTPDL